MSPISNSEIKNILQTGLKNAEVIVDGDGYQYQISVVCDSFINKSTVQRHKLIYALLADEIAEGRLHALSLKALTPEETK